MKNTFPLGVVTTLDTTGLLVSKSLAIVDGVTGFLVPIEQETDGTGTPLNPKKFEADFAAKLTEVLENPEMAKKMGQAGLERARDKFSWQAIGEETVELYKTLVK